MKRERWRHVIVLGSAVVLIAGLTPVRALAIPAFARRYQTSCTTCHVLIPKLNAFGIAFRNNGYRIPPSDEQFVRMPDVPLGAPAWKRLWPDAIWPGGLPAIAPIAIGMQNDVVIDPSQPAKLDFVFPNAFALMAGGTAGEGISYFADLEVVASQVPEGADRVVLDRMFVQFDHLGGTTLANLRAGRFEMRAVPFSRFHRRLTPSDFLALDFRNPADGIHLRSPQAGIEFWGARTGANGRGGLEYAVGVVNGNGPGVDNNTAKDIYTRFAYKFGGFGVTGSDDDSGQLDGARSWRDDSVKVGFSSYVGRGKFADGADNFWRLGADVDVFFGDVNISAVAFHGHDHLVDGQLSSGFTAGSVEGNYVIKPWVIGIVRYETVVRDDGPDIRRVVPAIALAIRANVRVVADWEAFLSTTLDGVAALSGQRRGRIRLEIVF